MKTRTVSAFLGHTQNLLRTLRKTHLVAALTMAVALGGYSPSASAHTASVATLAELKTAIATAQTDGADDTITLTANITFTAAVDAITINVTDGKTLTINGGGFGVDAALYARVFDVSTANAGSAAVLANLTIRNGFVGGAGGNAGDSVPGGDALGGAIRNVGVLAIRNASITDNGAAGGGAGGGGATGAQGAGGGAGCGSNVPACGAGGNGIAHSGTVIAGSAGGFNFGGNGGGMAVAGGGGGSQGGLSGMRGVPSMTTAGGGTGGRASNGSMGVGGGGGGAGTSMFSGRGGDAVGAIYNTGSLTITGSTFTRNIAAGGGGGGTTRSSGTTSTTGIGGAAIGAVWNNNGTLNIDSASIANMSFNRADRGGGGTVSSSFAPPGARANDIYTTGLLAVTNTSFDPTITSATYDAASGVLSVTAVNMSIGHTIDVSKLTLSGEGGSYTLTTANVTASSATAFSVTLNAADKLNVSSVLNKNGITAVGGATFNLAGSADWNATTPAPADLTGNPVTVTGIVAPDAPIIGTATAGNAQATITFTAPLANGGGGILSYTATSSPGGFAAICTAPCASASITVIGLTNGTAYSFTIVANNAAGASAASAASNSVTPKATQTITFNNPGAQNFGTTPTLTATSTSGLAVSFNSTTLPNCDITPTGTLSFSGVGSCFIIATQAGNAAFSAAADVERTFTISAVPPNTPTIGTATPGNAQATVTFMAPSISGGSAISGYTATCGLQTQSAMGSPITVSGLSNGTTVNCSVVARNLAGASVASATVSVTLPPACTAGNFSATGVVPCTPAPAGSYVPVAAAIGAIPCAAGSYSLIAGVASCTPAAIGFYVPSTGATAQLACAAGTYTPVTGAVACTVNPPSKVTVSFNGSPVNGTVSPLGVTLVSFGGSLDVQITANSRYVAVVGGTCAGRIITSTALVPQGAGSNTYRTDTVNADCSITVSFEAVRPTITVSGSTIATPPNATPTQTFSVISAPATFTAKLSGAIGVLNFFNTAIPPAAPVFIAFQADGVAIAGCEQQPIARVFKPDESITQASCTTTALGLGNRIITASFSGDNYNFPAEASASATPTQALTHVIIAVGAPPPVALPPVVVPPVVIPPVVVPPGSSTLPTLPASLPAITLTLQPVAALTASSQTPSNPTAANGTVTPNGVNGTNGAGGVLDVGINSTVDLAITANPRYLASVTGTCGGRVITSQSLVPQGAGSNTYRTAEVGQQCTVIINFNPAIPTITVSGSNGITPINTTPESSISVIDQPTTFTATMRQAIGVIGLNRSSPSTVYISFYADGTPIVGCEQQVITQAFGLDDSYHQATCSTVALSLGQHKITVSFSGDKYNFPAITDSNKTPSPVLTHIVREGL